ncbi:SIS domain-containing protein [Pelagibacterium lentulum]|uniref:Transcriptional regulator HexR n=1 Tax=Pelagibacterium lentulum TaxID=2029865 RepID=A0A916RMA0_9HYPH|nr:SIS domain-containing protein [Pelagibacterium lentulum]GGA61691.1 transcriptional regulator HexR [Pelagibacterium lentulum]
MHVAEPAGEGNEAQSGERFLERLSARRNRLSPSEQRVADFVLANPGRVIHMSIGNLADTVGVSQPTVLRFVRSLGLKRYPDLKLLTGQSIVSGTPYVHSEVDARDSLEAIVGKVIDSSILALGELRSSIDQSALEQAVDALTRAPRIDCYGTGSASALAIEAQHKLMRFGIPVVAYADTHIQRLAAATLRRGDVAICFSHTGMVADTLKMAERAQAIGATVIGVTKPGTALAYASDILLAVDAHENTEIYAPMISRVVHGATIDIVATAMALKFGPKHFERLREAKDSLSDLRINPPERSRREGRVGERQQKARKR